VTEVVIVRLATRGHYRIVVRAASISSYSVSKYGTSFIYIWLNCKCDSRGNS
jgi:hypothetical protein